jgi:hypothetical protein
LSALALLRDYHSKRNAIGIGEDGRRLLHCHSGCDVNGILAAAYLEHGGTIYITEGEKDADRLWSRRQSGFRDDIRRDY